MRVTTGPRMYDVHMVNSFLHHHMTPPCSNAPTLVFMCQALRLCSMIFVIIVLFHVIADVVQPCIIGSPLIPFPCICTATIFLVVSSHSARNTWPYKLLLRPFSLFEVGTSSLQSPIYSVLCFFYLYLFLLHVFV